MGAVFKVTAGIGPARLLEQENSTNTPLPEQQLRILSHGKSCFFFEILPEFVDNRPSQRHRSRPTSYPS